MSSVFRHCCSFLTAPTSFLRPYHSAGKAFDSKLNSTIWIPKGPRHTQLSLGSAVDHLYRRRHDVNLNILVHKEAIISLIV